MLADNLYLHCTVTQPHAGIADCRVGLGRGVTVDPHTVAIITTVLCSNCNEHVYLRFCAPTAPVQ